MISLPVGMLQETPLNVFISDFNATSRRVDRLLHLRHLLRLVRILSSSCNQTLLSHTWTRPRGLSRTWHHAFHSRIIFHLSPFAHYGSAHFVNRKHDKDSTDCRTKRHLHQPRQIWQWFCRRLCDHLLKLLPNCSFVRKRQDWGHLSGGEIASCSCHPDLFQFSRDIVCCEEMVRDDFSKALRDQSRFRGVM